MKNFEFKVDKPKKINKREKTEIILFHMPSELEAFLAALAAVEAYEYLRDLENTNAILNGSLVTNYVIHVCCPSGYAEFLSDRFKWVSHSECKFPTDLEVYMDVERATNIACTSKRSLVEGFAIMIGGDLRTIFPTTIRYGSTVLEREWILLLDWCSPWNGWDELESLLEVNFGDFKVVRQSKFVVDGKYASSINGLLPAVIRCGAVIGVRSAATYMAAAKKKSLIELSTGTYPNWLGKWEDPYYDLIYDPSHNIKNISPTLVYSVFARNVEETNLRQRITWPL